MARAGVLVVCWLLPAGALVGCSTTQEKAANQQARARHILEARAQRHERSRSHHDQGSKKR